MSPRKRCPTVERTMRVPSALPYSLSRRHLQRFQRGVTSVPRPSRCLVVEVLPGRLPVRLPKDTYRRSSQTVEAGSSEPIGLLNGGNLEMEKRRITMRYSRASGAFAPVRYSPRRERLGMENQGRCSEERNPASLKHKRQNPDRLSRRGFALNKNRQSWRIEIWLPRLDSNQRPTD